MNTRSQKLLFGGLVTLSLLATLLAVAAYLSLAYKNRVLPNTQVAGVSIGGLSPNDALAKLEAKAGELSGQSLVVMLNGEEKTFTFSDLGIALQPEASTTLETKQSDQWFWVKPGYWKHFLTAKKLPLPYRIEEDVLNAKLKEAFNVNTEAKNAQVVVKNSELHVEPSLSGQTLDNNGLELALTKLTSSGVISPIEISYTETPAQILTEQAEVIKKEITGVIQPVHLEYGSRKFTLSSADQYKLIAFDTSAGSIRWSVSEELLKNHLNTLVAKKINVKMAQKVVQSDTKAVLQEGRDGKEVDLSNLSGSILSVISARAATADKPIEIPVKTIAFTERVEKPGYVLNLYPGLYVDVNLSKQMMYIIEGENILHQFLISSGIPGKYPTPSNVTLYVKNKIDLAQSRLYPGIWMRKWNALAKNPDGSGYEGYGIHDLPCFNKECTLIEGAAHLGRPVSHGCIRLGPDSAAWFYDNIPVGTPVHIH